MFDIEKAILPDFPRTQHLPLEPNATSDDRVASEREMKDFLAQPHVYIQEKIDGANSGIALYNGHPLVRNRNHILNKAYAPRKTPAQTQFSAIWTWFYTNQKKLEKLEKKLGFLPSVYGEWLFAQHVIAYDKLPDWFIAYDIYDHERKLFIDPNDAIEALKSVGFATAPNLAVDVRNTSELLALRDGPSAFADTPREGIYLKSSDGLKVTGRFKMVAPWYKSDDDWNKKALTKNKLC